MATPPPPGLGQFQTVLAGTAGEDGQTWFRGGPGAAPIEIAVPVSNPGFGVVSVALHLDANDVQPGTPLDPLPIPAPDGSVHFQLPASGARREGPLHFSLTATDSFGQSVSAPAASILVDPTGPSVTAPHVGYAGAQPAAVCDPSVSCGRQAGTHLLRDDSADLTFDVTDCGVGTSSGAIRVANGSAVAAVETGSGPSSCANGNRTHHFKATVGFAAAAPALPAADASGTVLLPVSGTGTDRLSNQGIGAAPAGAIGGDGLALISIWRWKRKMVGVAAGSPVVLPGGGTARVAVGTATAVTAFSTMGAQSWSQSVSAGVGADLALGPSGNIYAVSPAVACAPSCLGTLTIVGASGPPQACAHASVSLGAPAAVTTANGSETAIVVATARRTAVNPDNLYLASGGCGGSSFQYLNNSNELTGVTALAGASTKIFVSSAAGFTPIDYNGTTFTPGVAYTPQANAPAPPALIAASPMQAVFGTSTGQLHRAICGPGCWQDAWASAPYTPGVVSTTPVFDGAHVYANDDAGDLSSWEQATGAPEWLHPLGNSMSGPVILAASSPTVLVVQIDGSVTLANAAGVTSLIHVGGYDTVPPAPALEPSGSYGIAYVPDGAAWLWAIDLPAPPMQASATAWPRPGRDSCNSRSAGASCP